MEFLDFFIRTMILLFRIILDQTILKRLNHAARAGVVVRTGKGVKGNQIDLATNTGPLYQLCQLLGVFQLIINAIQHGVFKGHATVIRQSIQITLGGLEQRIDVVFLVDGNQDVA